MTAKAANARTAMTIPIRDIRLLRRLFASIAWPIGTLKRFGRAQALREQLELASASRNLDSLQMQCLRFAGAYNWPHLEIHHVGLPGNAESPPRYV